MPQENHPPRKVYHITLDGKRNFFDWLHHPILTMRRMRVEFPTKLYFFRTLGLEGADDLISAQEAFCQEQVARLKQKAAQRDPDDLLRLVFDFRRYQIEATIGWLHDCRGKM
jgi:DNA-binding PadR family transcriptional regulator